MAEIIEETRTVVKGDAECMDEFYQRRHVRDFYHGLKDIEQAQIVLVSNTY